MVAMMAMQGINNATIESHTKRTSSWCDTAAITEDDPVLEGAVYEINGSQRKRKENVISNQQQVTSTSTSSAGCKPDRRAFGGMLCRLY